MKILRSLSLCVLLSASLQTVSAQLSKGVNPPPGNTLKPRLFKDAPSRVVLKQNEFDKLFTYGVGHTVSLSLAPDFSLAGTVVSKAEDERSQVKSIVVRCSDKPGASFTLSRIINENNTISYSGRMMSFKHADAYEMVLDNNDYVLIKKEASDIYEE